MHNLNPSVDSKTLRWIERQIGDLIETAPCGYIFTDPSGKLIKVNSTLLNWLGYEAEALMGGTSLRDLISRGGRIYYETHFLPLLHMQGSVKELNFTLVTKKGKRMPVLLSAKQHLDDNGRPVFNSVVIVDFTDRKKYELELLNAKKEAESSERAKSSFLSTVGHEVLTPLNAIIGATKLLETTAPTDKQQQLIDLLSGSSQHLFTLFKNVLVVAKSGLHELETTNRPFDLRSTVGDVVTSFRYGVVERGFNIFLDIDNRIPKILLGDPVLLSQVLTNLIGNAVKFTEEGEIRIDIKLVDTDGEKQLIRFEVNDTGIGIASDQLEKLLEPFVHADDHIHSTYGGSGLGLSICNAILQRFGSKVSITSTLEEGSCFYFDLWFTRAKQESLARQAHKNLPPLNLGRVLLVEDNETNIFLVSSHFKRWQVKFDTARNGKEAVACAKANKYGLVLMDLKMPVMDGYEAASQIRVQTPPHSLVPIVAFSASASLTRSSRMKLAKIDDFLLKPFDPRDLYAVVKKYLSKSAASGSYSTKNTMNFKALRSAFDDDTEELESFADILVNELTIATRQLDSAIGSKDDQAVGDLKHKLKTSLQLLNAESLRDALQSTVDGLRAGRDVSKERELIHKRMTALTQRLKAEKW